MARTMNYNPYERGRNSESPEPDDDRYAFRPATRGKRFLGAMIDGVINGGMIYILRSAMKGAPLTWGEIASPGAQEQHAGAALLASLVPTGILAWLIARRGQSLGKIIMGTRIVDKEGRRAGLYNGFVLRTLPFAALGLVQSILLLSGLSSKQIQPFTFLVSFVASIDSVLILGARRRCLHDRIAGTYVAVVGTERPPGDAAPRRP